MVPVVCLLSQVSEPFLQLRFLLWDAVDDWSEVGKRVQRTDPVVCGTGFWSDRGSLQVNMKINMLLVIVLLLGFKYNRKSVLQVG